jgi:hypothetical protein
MVSPGGYSFVGNSAAETPGRVLTLPRSALHQRLAQAASRAGVTLVEGCTVKVQNTRGLDREGTRTSADCMRSQRVNFCREPGGLWSIFTAEGDDGERLMQRCDVRC